MLPSVCMYIFALPVLSLFGKVEFFQIHALKLQQAYFVCESPSVAGEGAVAAYHTVTGDEDGDGVVSHCAAHRSS